MATIRRGATLFPARTGLTLAHVIRNQLRTATTDTCHQRRGRPTNQCWAEDSYADNTPATDLATSLKPHTRCTPPSSPHSWRHYSGQSLSNDTAIIYRCAQHVQGQTQTASPRPRFINSHCCTYQCPTDHKPKDTLHITLDCMISISLYQTTAI